MSTMVDNPLIVPARLPAIDFTPVHAPSLRPSPQLFDFALLFPPGDDGELIHFTFRTLLARAPTRAPPHRVCAA
jgi:hypothetical protein